MIQPSAYDLLIAHLVKQGELAQAESLSILIHSETSERRLRGDSEVQLKITSQDRDHRRTRMEVAQWVLDYERGVPANEIWGVLIGTHVVITRHAYEFYAAQEHALQQGQPHVFGTMTGAASMPSVHAPDPTAIPTGIDSCVTMGHRWGVEFINANGYRVHTCTVCNDTRLTHTDLDAFAAMSTPSYPPCGYEWTVDVGEGEHEGTLCILPDGHAAAHCDHRGITLDRSDSE